MKEKNIDSVDIVQHFKLRADITMRSVGMLQKENRIKRVWLWGFRYAYITYDLYFHQFLDSGIEAGRYALEMLRI